MSNNRRSLSPNTNKSKGNQCIINCIDVNPLVEPDKLEEVIKKDTSADTEVVNIMWEKLVLYYLARLKGLCDWRGKGRNKKMNKSKKQLDSYSDENLETQVVKNVTEEMLSSCPRDKDSKSTDQDATSTTNVGTYMAAGYEEGKHQAAKIVTRSLHYGVLTGILVKEGNSYHVSSKYLDDQGHQKTAKDQQEKKPKRTRNRKCDRKDKLQRHYESCKRRRCAKYNVQSIKRNVRKRVSRQGNRNTLRRKINDSPMILYCESKEEDIDYLQSSRSISPINVRRGIKRKISHSHQNCAKRNKRKIISSSSSEYIPPTKRSRKRNYEIYDDEYFSDSSVAPVQKKAKYDSDTKIKVVNSISSRSISPSKSESPLTSRDKTKTVKAKQTGRKLKKPAVVIPPAKRPRTKSQSKSPSRSGSDDQVPKDYVTENSSNNDNNRYIINTFHLPTPRRCSDVISSVSSSSSIFPEGLCSVCRKKRNNLRETKRLRSERRKNYEYLKN